MSNRYGSFELESGDPQHQEKPHDNVTGGGSCYPDQPGSSSHGNQHRSSNRPSSSHASSSRHHHSARHGSGDHSSSSIKNSSVRSMQKKIETLRRETAKAESELEELEHRKKKAKHAARSAADEGKADFLRSAAHVQRQIDASADEFKTLQEQMERDEVELLVLRRKLKEQDEANQEQRAQMEQAKQEKLAALHAEIQSLRG